MHYRALMAFHCAADRSGGKMTFFFAALVVLAVHTSFARAGIFEVVDALRKNLNDDLQTLELQYMGDNRPPLHKSGYDPIGQLLYTFHEFESLNLESKTAVSRVLSLIDHTSYVNNDCEKVFDLASLESNNVLFRTVTRPLLAQVERLCRVMADNQLDTLEETMEQVEQEADSYRKRYDIVMQHLSAVEEYVLSLPTWRLWEEYEEEHQQRIGQLNYTLREQINNSLEEFLKNQQQAYEAVLNELNISAVALTKNFGPLVEFGVFLENKTLAMQYIFEELVEDWVTQMEEIAQWIDSEIEDFLGYRHLEPMELFLRGDIDLPCLSENFRVTTNIYLSLIRQVFACANAGLQMKHLFDMVAALLRGLDMEIVSLMDSYRSCARAAKDLQDGEQLLECFVMSDIVMSATQDFVNFRTVSMYDHVFETMEFNEMKIEMCFHHHIHGVLGELFKASESFEYCDKKVVLPVLNLTISDNLEPEVNAE